MSDTHPNLEHRLEGHETRLESLENWRLLIVDPQLAEHGTKITGFERIEMQITGVVKFLKIVGSVVGVIAAICETIRAIAPFVK